MCFVRPVTTVAAVYSYLTYIKCLLIRQCCHLVRLCCIVLSMFNRIFSVSLENTARMETMTKKCPMNNKGFQIAVARSLFRGTDPFRFSDFNYLWQEKSKNHHTLTVKISKPCFYSLMNYGCHRHKHIDVTLLIILGLGGAKSIKGFFSWHDCPYGSGPPHCRGFTITLSQMDTPHSVGLLWTGDRLETRTSS
jgi:hypothetical protein